MKKLLVYFFVGIIITTYSFTLQVNADEIYYTNSNNVSMTREEYEFFGEMYWDGYQEYVTQDVFNRFQNNGYFENTIEKAEYDEDNVINLINGGATINSNVHETNAKKLTISKVCSGSLCGFNVLLQWKGTPNVKSYDVIGALIYGGLTTTGDVNTTLFYSGGTLFYGDEYYVGGGFGTSVKLQNSTTNMKILQTFDTVGTGVVYASYQHATQNITKATSQKYTVGYGGYGGVFHFYGAAVGKFDQMGGVNMVVS